MNSSHFLHANKTATRLPTALNNLLLHEQVDAKSTTHSACQAIEIQPRRFSLQEFPVDKFLVNRQSIYKVAPFSPAGKKLTTSREIRSHPYDAGCDWHRFEAAWDLSRSFIRSFVHSNRAIQINSECGEFRSKRRPRDPQQS